MSVAPTPSSSGVRRAQRGGLARLSALAVLVIAGLLLVAWPGASVLAALITGRPSGAGAAPVVIIDFLGLSRTACYAALIGGLAAILALPGSWVVRGLGASASGFRARATVGLLIAPLLLPSYLAYAGWGVLRGPGSVIGDWAAVQAPWVSVAVGECFAVLGMVLWAWPLAALVMGVMLMPPRLSDGAWESLRLEARSWRVWAARARLAAPALGTGAGVVALLTIGSAIPLHVAQVQTYAIRLWKHMQTLEQPEWAFLSCGPLVVLAAGSALIVVRRLGARGRRPDGLTPEETGAAEDLVVRKPADRATWMAAAGVWMLSVVAPAVLFLSSLKQWRALADFWIVGGNAVVESIRIAVCVGAAGVLLAVATCAAGSLNRPLWAARNGQPARPGWSSRRLPVAVLLALGVSTFVSLMPGVLVGTAIHRAYGSGLHGWGRHLPVVLAHVARWGVVAVLIGARMSLSEGRALREMRMMDERSSAVSFWYLLIRPNLGLLGGVWFALACLSMHEIESTIMVQPPGEQTLAQIMLDWLHFSKEDALAAGCVNLLAVASVLALASAWLLGPLVRPGRLRHPGSEPIQGT